MNRETLRQLADLTIEDGAVNGRAREFVLTKLSRADMKRYLFYLRAAVSRQKVHVRLSHESDPATKAEISRIFEGNKVLFEVNAALGGGLQVEFTDSIVNINVRNLIERTIARLKETL